MKSRANVIGYFEKFVSSLEWHSGKKERGIHTDNARSLIV